MFPVAVVGACLSLVASACSTAQVSAVAYTLDFGALGDVQTVELSIGAGASTIDEVSGTTRISGVLTGIPLGSHTLHAAAYGRDVSVAAAAVSAEVELTQQKNRAVVRLQFAAPEVEAIVVSNASPATGEDILLTAEVAGGLRPLLIWHDDCAGDFGPASGNTVQWHNAVAETCTISVSPAYALSSSTVTNVHVRPARGTIETVAGNGCFVNGDYYLQGLSEDGSQYLAGVWDENGMAIDTGMSATAVQFNKLTGMDFDAQGRLVFADRYGGRVLRIEPDGTLTRIIGRRVPDNMYAACDQDSLVDDNHCLGQLADIQFYHKTGQLYIGQMYRSGGLVLADLENDTMTEIYDGGSFKVGFTVDQDNGNITIGDAWEQGLRWVQFADYSAPETRFTTADTLINTSDLVEGGPWDVEIGAGGIVYTARMDSQIWRIDPTGKHVLVAGNPVANQPGYSGDGGPALNAAISNPRGLVLHPDGSIIFADSGNGAIRKISPDGTISTLLRDVGDVWDVLLDKHNNLYMSGHSFCEIRKVYGPF